MMAKHMNFMHQLHPRDDPCLFLVSRTQFTTTRKRTSAAEIPEGAAKDPSSESTIRSSSPSPASTESRSPKRAAVQHRWRQRASKKAVNRLLGYTSSNNDAETTAGLPDSRRVKRRDHDHIAPSQVGEAFNEWHQGDKAESGQAHHAAHPRHGATKPATYTSSK